MQYSSQYSPHSKCLMAFALFVLAFNSRPAHADYMFTASQTATSTQSALDAEAYFAFGKDTLTIYLANLQSGINSQGQAISGLQFNIGNPTITPSISKVFGETVNVSGGRFGTQTYQSFDGSSNPAYANWAITSNSPNNMTDLGSGAPQYLIVGPSANFSGVGNNGSKFNPYFQSNATAVFNAPPTTQGDAVVFVLSASGLTSDSIISGVKFEFGTGPDTTLSGSPGPGTGPGGEVITNPAPSSAILFSLGGLALLGFMAQSRRRLLAAA
jgi:hypothetical protein